MTAHGKDIRHMASLMDEVETLREENRQLRQALLCHDALPQAWNLAKREAELFRAILAAAPHTLHYERAMIALYGDRSDPPCVDGLSVLLNYLRARLRPHGIEIACQRGRGFYLDAENLARVRTAIAAVASTPLLRDGVPVEGRV